jgi:parallel beta-helix repeat protein
LSRTKKLQKYITVGVILLFVGTYVSSSTAQILEKTQPTSRTGKWFVGGSGLGNYTRIQDAIDNASNGDIVFVYSGKYNESIMINKSIVVCGEDRNTTFIVGGNKSEIVRIDETSAEFKRFTVESQSNEFINGIYVSDCWSVSISENYIKSCEYGILITSSESLSISNNTILDCSSGIVNVITGNVTIIQNKIEGKNEGSGIEFQAAMFKNYVIQNSISNNSIGINLLFTLFTVVQENNLLENQQSAFFTSSLFTKWQQNYWNRSRLLPKIIPGQFGSMVIHKWIPLINFDWKPAQKPYDIKG